MGSSGRWISRSGAAGIFRSLRVRGDGNFNYSPHLRNSRCCRELAENRTISSISSFESPWLMLEPKIDGEGRFVYRFQCLAKNYVYSFFSNEYSRSPSGRRWISDELKNEDQISDFRFVGSSHGWVALYNERIHDLFLSDPITDRHIKLPPLHTLGVVNRLILSSSPEENGCLALMTFGSGDRLAFCSPLRSHEWTLFGGGGEVVYDNLVYSRRHNRLFCITSAPNTKLEVWDVPPHQSPRLDWMMKADFNKPRSNFKKLKYIVSAEQTGELYLVVRHVIIRGGRVDLVAFSEYTDPNFSTPPYDTVDIDVYKIDGGEVTRMENSLEGLAIFVGMSHPFAIIPAASASELKPNSVYFTYDDRLRPPYGFGGNDNGIFDYQKRDFSFSPFRNPHPINHPIWFTPSHNLR